MIKYPTNSQKRRYTILWNLNGQNWSN